MNFYISDLHLGHDNIIKLCDRPFANVEEMNETLIRNWNSKVTNADTVYIIGDLFFRCATNPKVMLSRLKGKKHLIVGNHDKSWMNNFSEQAFKEFFASVSNLLVINTGKGMATLCHYPMMAFEGAYLIYGHIHNNKNDTYWKLLSQYLWSRSIFR